MAGWRDTLLSVESDGVGRKLVSAVNKLLRDDAFLLSKDAHERSITHRLAVYLEDEFPDWNVDCEYNRDGHDPKRVGFEAGKQDESKGEGSLVYPDIIVHHRGQRDNLLVVEVKSKSGGDKRDKHKLCAYKSGLGYSHALFLRFTRHGAVKAEWIDGA